jgi:hypothetical protein
MTMIGTPAVNQRSGGTHLYAGTAGDAGAFAQRHASICNEEALGAPFFKSKGKVAHKLSASPHAAPAEDAAVVFHDDIWMGSIYRVWLKIGGKGPVGHSFCISGVL